MQDISRLFTDYYDYLIVYGIYVVIAWVICSEINMYSKIKGLWIIVVFYLFQFVGLLGKCFFERTYFPSSLSLFDIAGYLGYFWLVELAIILLLIDLVRYKKSHKDCYPRNSDKYNHIIKVNRVAVNSEPEKIKAEGDTFVLITKYKDLLDEGCISNTEYQLLKEKVLYNTNDVYFNNELNKIDIIKRYKELLKTECIDENDYSIIKAYLLNSRTIIKKENELNRITLLIKNYELYNSKAIDDKEYRELKRELLA